MLEDCYYVEISYSMVLDGETLPFEEGEIRAYFAAGLGLYGMEQYAQEYEGETVVDSWETDYWVSRAALDNRWDILD